MNVFLMYFMSFFNFITCARETVTHKRTVSAESNNWYEM